MAAAPEQDSPGQATRMAEGQGLRAWVEYLRDMGVYDLYRRDASRATLPEDVLQQLRVPAAPPATPNRTPSLPVASAAAPARPADLSRLPKAPPSAALPLRPPVLPQAAAPPAAELPRSYFTTEEESQKLPPELLAPMPKPNPLESLFPMPATPLPAGDRSAALERLLAEIGDCTRCPLAYAGRHTIVFGEGDPNADLMFVGEGPGADEDVSGRPFVGKAGQLLNNMIGAMGLQREQVFIANIVKCRPPGNRTPEFAEATTCSQFLLKQIDIVRPKVIVALGSTAATYLLGVRQSLASLRGQWLEARGAKVAVTYHPAFLLRDPRQKSEAWKDLQRVMGELGLKAAAK